MTSAASLNGEVFLSVTAFDLIFNNFVVLLAVETFSFQFFRFP